MYNWLFFDADNTLFDFNRTSKLAFVAMLADAGIDLQPDYYPVYQKINHQVWQEFEQGQIDGKELRYRRFALFLEAIQKQGDALKLNEYYLNNLIEHTHLLEGAAQMLLDLRKQYQLAIITNGLREVQRPRLRHSGLTELFEVIVVSDEIGVAKPDAAALVKP